jgi:hypothetical protein
MSSTIFYRCIYFGFIFILHLAGVTSELHTVAMFVIVDLTNNTPHVNCRKESVFLPNSVFQAAVVIKFYCQTKL